MIKKDEVVLAYHQIRVFVQDPKDPEKVARYDVGIDLFDYFFEEMPKEKAPA